MDALEFTRKRLLAILDEIKRLNESEFPYEHSQKALKILRELFSKQLNRILMAENEVAYDYSLKVLEAFFKYLPILGFILRSTNVRNAFEIYGPLLRLAGELLESESEYKNRTIKLILSSEWYYSPHIYFYSQFQELKGFVLIGFPASESSNPLLIPLAGHELGHILWINLVLTEKIELKINKEIINIIQKNWEKYAHLFDDKDINKDTFINSPESFEKKIWSKSLEWSLSQAQESFCDFIGIKIFGLSYLCAFAYLISPSISRSVYYPNIMTRVNNFVKAADKYGYICPKDYISIFIPETEKGDLSSSDKLMLSLADEALDAVIDELIKIAGKEIDKTNIKKSSEEDIKAIYKRFEKIVPAENCKNLFDILNAAWKAFENKDFWKNELSVFEEDKREEMKDKILKELVLKNIEVFEIEQLKQENKND